MLTLRVALSFTVYLAFPAPRVAPTNITAFNTSSTSLHVTWQPISTEGLRGILRAYRVYYIEQKTYFTRSLKNVTVDSASLEVELVDLYKFTNYTVYVVARTNKDGVSSEKVNASTDEDSKYILSIGRTEFMIMFCSEDGFRAKFLCPCFYCCCFK